MARTQGTIVKRGPDTYLIRLAVGKDAAGKRLYDSKTVKGSLKDAQRELAALVTARDTNTRVEKSSHTVKEWLDLYIDGREKAKAITSYTAAGYRESAALYTYPYIGALPLAALTHTRVQQWINDLLDKELAASTVRSAFVILQASLKKALKAKYLPSLPTSGVDIPAKTRKGQGHALTAEQATDLLKHTMETPWYSLWAFLLGTGLRPGEAAALTWDDLKDDIVTVRKSLVWMKDGQFIIEPPKTEAGIRSFPLPSSLAKLLKQHRMEQMKVMLRRGEAYERKNLVFPNARGGYLHITTIRQAWKMALKRASLPRNLRLYDTRHTCFTLLLAGGIHPKVVQERAGHSSFQVTMDAYSHVTKGMQEKANDVLEGVLSVAERDLGQAGAK